MEPLTQIQLNNCKWMGLLAVAFTAAAELLSIAANPNQTISTFTEREKLRRTIARRRSREQLR